MFELYGICPEDFSGASNDWDAGVHPEDRLASQLTLQQALDKHTEGQPLRMVGVNPDLCDRNASEQDLLEQQRLLDTFVSSSTVGICVMDDQLRYTLINNALADINGVPVADHIGKTPWDIVPDLAAKQVKVFRQVLTTGEAVPEFEVVGETARYPGMIRTWLASYFPLKSESGQTIGIGIIVVETTERSRAEQALRDSEENFRQLAENIQDVFWLTDAQINQFLYISPAYEQIWGRSCESLRRDPSIHLSTVHPEDRQLLAQALSQPDNPFEVEYRIIQPNGAVRWIRDRGFPVFDASGRLTRRAGLARDITERKQVEAQLIHNALHDALTDLPNRSLLINRLELAIHRAQRSPNYQFAVLFLDLDQFKVINDSLGHLVGDQLLIAVADKLQHILRATDLAARLGGDEFVILLEEIEGVQTAVQVAERIFAEFETTHLIDQRNIFITTSVGIVLGSAAYTDATDLLRDADIALYRAKAQGRAKYEIFDAEMHTQALKRMNLEHDLRRAIEQQEFTIHYQPIVTLNAQKLIGFEALVRWQHPTHGSISPADFIPVAEETGLIIPIDQWLLQSACQQLVEWRRQFPEWSDLKISINLSFQDLRQPNLLETVIQSLEHSGLEAKYLTLEITESMLIENIESTIGLLKQMRELGIQISIDDFGTGYSSLSYLYSLPTDYLKIDQSFVRKMQKGDKNSKIVEAIISLSNQLGMDAIAEGIETSQQLEWLEELGCELGQGYLFAKPLTPEAVVALLSYETQPKLSDKE